MLGVCRSGDDIECVSGNLVAQRTLDLVEEREITVVHKDVTTELERVGIPAGDSCTRTGCADVSEDGSGGSVFANGNKVGIRQGLPHDLVESRLLSLGDSEGLLGGVVPNVMMS